MTLTPTVWLVLTGLLVAVEMATGTFYLLMFSLGTAAAALAAWLGLDTTWQIMCAAVVGGGAVAAWHLKRRQSPPSAPVSRNADAQIDLGETVLVQAWQTDGSTRVTYRGSPWLVKLAPGALATPGPHRIVAVEGNCLVLSPISPH